MQEALSDQTLTTQEIPPQSAVAVQTGTGVNASGWDGVQFVINLGAFTGAAVCDARVVSSANSNFNGATNVAGAALVQIAASAQNNLFVIDVLRPVNTYLRCLVTPAVNSIILAATATRYKRAGILPSTQPFGQIVKVSDV